MTERERVNHGVESCDFQLFSFRYNSKFGITI